MKGSCCLERLMLKIKENNWYLSNIKQEKIVKEYNQLNIAAEVSDQANHGNQLFLSQSKEKHQY